MLRDYVTVTLRTVTVTWCEQRFQLLCITQSFQNRRKCYLCSATCCLAYNKRTTQEESSVAQATSVTTSLCVPSRRLTRLVETP